MQEIKVQEIRGENMMWDAMEMRHETKGVSSTNDIETSIKMHSKAIVTWRKINQQAWQKVIEELEI